MPKWSDRRAISGFWNWSLGFTWDLGFGIWDLGAAMIRVTLPHHLRTLARVTDEVQLEVNGAATVCSVLDALEAKYPMLQGTIRDHGTLKRRPMVRFFVCGQDVSLDPADTALPEAIVKGTEPFIIMGAIAGG
jgi:sulfur-carrier protein